MQAETADAAAGRTAARSLLSQLGALRSPVVEVRRTATTVTARVDGRAQQLVPGLPLRVTAAAEGPVERFVPETPR